MRGNNRTLTQTSKPYRYFDEESRKTTRMKLEKTVERIKTDLALEKLYEHSEIRIIELEKEQVFQIVVVVNIPVVVEEE